RLGAFLRPPLGGLAAAAVAVLADRVLRAAVLAPERRLRDDRAVSALGAAIARFAHGSRRFRRFLVCAPRNVRNLRGTFAGQTPRPPAFHVLAVLGGNAGLTAGAVQGGLGYPVLRGGPDDRAGAPLAPVRGQPRGEPLGGLVALAAVVG